MKTAQALATLEELGSSQWGLVTAAQAQAYGVSRVTMGRLREAGMVHPLRRGVYALPSSGQGPLQDLKAAWLATKPTVLAEERIRGLDEIAVSHRSAAAVHGLGGVMPTRHEFTTASRRTSSHTDVAFHRRALEPDELNVVDGLLVTSIERTVADISGPGVDLDHLAEVVRDALGHERVKASRLAQSLSPAAKHLGFPSGGALIEECLERAGMPASMINAIPHLWHRALNRQLQASVMPKVGLTALWPSVQMAGPSQSQLTKHHEYIQQLVLESMRGATIALMKEVALPSPHRGGLAVRWVPPTPRRMPGGADDLAEPKSTHGRDGTA